MLEKKKFSHFVKGIEIEHWFEEIQKKFKKLKIFTSDNLGQKKKTDCVFDKVYVYCLHFMEQYFAYYFHFSDILTLSRADVMYVQGQRIKSGE